MSAADIDGEKERLTDALELHLPGWALSSLTEAGLFVKLYLRQGVIFLVRRPEDERRERPDLLAEHLGGRHLVRKRERLDF